MLGARLNNSVSRLSRALLYNKFNSQFGLGNISKFNELYSSKVSSLSSIIGQDFIVKSPHPPLPNVTNVSVTDLVQERTSEWAEQIAFECSVTGIKYTHNQVFRHAKNFGGALLKSGLRRNDVVIVLLPNGPEYAAVMHGMMSTGIIGSPLNPALTLHELKSMVSQCKPKAVVTIPQFLSTVKQIQADPVGASLKTVITIGQESSEGCHNFYEMIKHDATGQDGFLNASASDIDDQIATILWSSGTTGPAKGVLLTQKNLKSQILQIDNDNTAFSCKGKERVMGLLPFFHIFGNAILLNVALHLGVKVMTMPMFEPNLFTKVIKTHKPTIMHLVPPLVNFLIINPVFKKEDFEAVHTIVCSGATAGQNMITKILEKAEKEIFFQEAFGMTELTGASHSLFPSHGNNRIGSVGQPITSTVSKIVNLETGEALGPNSEGEICVKGPQIMRGYLNNDAATKTIIDFEGWLHTGDIGYYNDEGFFYIVDRLKELIKVKGMQVPPSELEELIKKHPKVVDVAVIGIPDERAGELPRAYIIPKDKSLEAEEIQDYLNDKVAKYKQLAGGIEFVQSIPKSPSGKTLRRQLREQYKKASDA